MFPPQQRPVWPKGAHAACACPQVVFAVVGRRPATGAPALCCISPSRQSITPGSACFFFFFEQVAQSRCTVLCSCSPFLSQILLFTTPAAAALLQNGSSEPHGVMQRVNCGASQAQLATARRSHHAQPGLATLHFQMRSCSSPLPTEGRMSLCQSHSRESHWVRVSPLSAPPLR